MSRVCHQRYRTSFAEELESAGPGAPVVAARALDVREVLSSETFPKETHWRKEGESTYTEYVVAWEITEVFRADLEVGDRIWIFRKPAYGRKAVRDYHEKGLSRSPMIRVREPEYPFDGDLRVLILHRYSRSTPEHPVVFTICAEEGPGAVDAARRSV